MAQSCLGPIVKRGDALSRLCPACYVPRERGSRSPDALQVQATVTRLDAGRSMILFVTWRSRQPHCSQPATSRKCQDSLRGTRASIDQTRESLSAADDLSSFRFSSGHREASGQCRKYLMKKTLGTHEGVGFKDPVSISANLRAVLQLSTHDTHARPLWE